MAYLRTLTWTLAALALSTSACGIEEEGLAEMTGSGAAGSGGTAASGGSGGSTSGGGGAATGGVGATGGTLASGGSGATGGVAGGGGSAGGGGAAGAPASGGAAGSGGSAGAGGTAGMGGSVATGGTGGTTSTGGTGGSVATGGTGGTTSTGGTGGSVATGGTGGSVATGGTGGTTGDPCSGKCTDAAATCTTSGVCQCGTGTINVDADSDPMTAVCKSSIIQTMTVKVAIDHGHVGHLTIKLRGPNSQLITLVSRPGENEGADDGGGIGGGDASNLGKDAPVTFDDVAGTAAEDMGQGLALWEVVCADGGPCSFKPDKGAASGLTTLKAAFGGVDMVGKWTLCVGDSNWTVGGALEQWGIIVQTSGGAIARQSPANMGKSIPDDNYNGSLGSMVCHDIVVQ